MSNNSEYSFIGTEASSSEAQYLKIKISTGARGYAHQITNKRQLLTAGKINC
jgi:hypothetical protein